MAQLLVTCVPPARDRDLDVGAFTSIYLAADIFARARRMLGDDVILATPGPVEGPAARTLARADIVLSPLPDRGAFDDVVIFAGSDDIAIGEVATLVAHLGQPRAIRLASLVDRGNAYAPDEGYCVWMSDLLDAVSADALRFYLALMGPDEAVRDFELLDIQRTVDLFLAGDLSASAVRAAELDASAMACVSSDRALDDFLGYLRESYRNAVSVDGFSLASLGNALLGINGQLKQSRIDEAYGQLPRLLALFSLLAPPLMPRFAADLTTFLGLAGDWGRDWLEHGGVVPPVSSRAISGPPPAIAPVDGERLAAIERAMRAHMPAEV